MATELLLVTFPISVVVFVCTVATLTDMTGRVIPNWLCYGALLAGLLFHGCVMLLSLAPGADASGWRFAVGIQGGISGAVTCAAVLLPFWLMGSIGGGDVKFVAALGMIVGPVLGLQIILFGCLFGIIFIYGTRIVRGMRAAAVTAEGTEQTARSMVAQSELPMAGFLSAATILVLVQALFSK